MIKSISEISNFGVYQNFKWKDIENIKDFQKKNILYGWNYSGKTTISRIFSSLRDKKIHDKFQSSNFKIVSDEGEISSSTLASYTTPVFVFNAEYIDENLKWHNSDKLDAISFDVGENVGIREEIEANSLKVLSIQGNSNTVGRKQKYQINIDIFDEFEKTKFTNEAKRIKNDTFNSLIEFNKSHLKNMLSNLTADYSTYRLSHNEIRELKTISIANNDKSIIPAINFIPKLEELYTKTKDILAATPPQEEVIERLEENRNLYNWAKDGYDLHIKTFDTCSFCGSSISPERLDQLLHYFSNESAKLRNSILLLEQEINQEIVNVSQINFPKSINDIIEGCRNDYEKQKESFDEIQKNYVSFLHSLKISLEKKEDGNLFLPLEIFDYSETETSEFNTWHERFNALLSEHNRIINDFDREQEVAREKLKQHLVADFLIRENYKEKQKKEAFSKKCISKFDRILASIEEKNSVLEAQLKSILAGKEELNKFIKAFLNSDNINIEVTEDDKFILKRGSQVAENLSEGEKTAISFAYFLVTLESQHRENKLVESIIFIDDPMSSLDANHIAQVYSLINSFFFRKGANPANPDEVIDCFKQLFISTHNFEFFSFLKDSKYINRKKPSSDVTAGCEYYFIQRVDNSNSRIQPLPKYLKRKSEYIYLFEILYGFHQTGCDMEAEYSILIPNALRRFFEMYTLIKLPDSEEEIDSRLNILMGEPHNLKLLHHFSHFTTFEKLMKHDELLMVLPSAMEELMTLLGQDSVHLDALKRAIGIEE